MSGTEEDVIEGVGNEEAVRVFVRIRPLNKREKDEKQTIGWNFNETSMLEDTQNGQRVYAYDHCFGMDSTNSETYEIVGKPIVLKAMEGYNGTVFTYGQTGSGKTWTMRGCAEDPGMMVLCIRDILDWVKSHPQTKYTLRVAYLEVYNEEINDLLGEVGPASKNLKIVSEDAAKGAVIGGLVEEIVKTAEDFMAVVTRGESSRSYASTNMNAESSRSHTIYRVSIEQSDKDDEPEDNSSFRSNKPVEPTGRVSYMNLVDLAGSERQKSTKAEGKVLKEGSNINKSLLALGAVINKLGEASKAPKKGAKPVFVPYRDSKLTRILKQSLGGNTLTSILCAVTPAPMHREETVSTLKFGQLCKSIKNQVKSNEFASEKDQIKQFKSTIEELRRQLEEYASGGLGLAAHVDPDTALGNALREKSELETKVRSLENMVMRGGSPGGIAFGGGSHDSEEVARLNDKLAEQSQIIERLQAHFDEHADLEEQRAHIEEYERQSRDEILEEATKLEREKDNLKTERSAFIRERSKNDDKESRIGSLITQLDEKESKLRQMLGTMKEQQEQWQRSVTDLQRREDLVDDWQSSHRQREKRLQEVDVHQEKKYQELNRREGEIVEEESRLKSAHLQLQEREQRLQVAQSRVANQEQQLQAYEEKLTGMENALKKKEGDGDIRDRELLSRRKEMESWDMLLKEKNRKIDVEQRTLDEREALIRSAEEKARLRDADAERRLVDLRQSEAAADEQMELYAQKHNEALERNRESQERDAASKVLREELVHKESELKAWEKRLGKMQERLSGIEKREADLHSRVEQHKAVEDDFFNVKVAQITARHRSELKGLQTLVQDQIKIVADAQSDRKAARAEVEKKNELIAEYEAAMEQHNVVVDELREKLRLYEEGGAVLPSGDASNNAATSGAASGGRRASSVDHNLNDAMSDHGGNVGSPKSRSNSLRKTPTIDMNDPNYQNSGTGGATTANLRSGLKRSNTFGSVDSDEEVEAELLRVNGKAGRAKSPSQPKSTHPAASTAPAVGKGPTAAVSTTDLNAHLRLTHKILYHILEKHNALPDKNAPLLLRRGPNTVPTTKATKPPADTPAPVATTEPQQTSTTPFQDTSELDGYQDANKMLNFNYYNESPPPPPPAQQMSRSAIRGSLYARRVSHSLTPAEQAMQTAQLQHQQQVQFSRRQSGGNGTFQTPEGGTAQQREAYRRASHTVSSPADMTNVYVTMSPQASNTLAQHTVNGYQMRRGSNMTSAAVVSGGHYGGNNSGGEDNGNGRTPTNINQQHHGSNTKRTPVHSGRNTSLTSPNGATPQRNSFASPTDLSSIVKNTVRNGIPVTTVNLGYSSGIKTARSEISTPNNANAGPKTPVKHQ